jgi:hypothetical protein
MWSPQFHLVEKNGTLESPRLMFDFDLRDNTEEDVAIEQIIKYFKQAPSLDAIKGIKGKSTKQMTIINYETSYDDDPKFWLLDLDTRKMVYVHLKSPHWGDALRTSNCDISEYDDNGFSTVIKQLVDRQTPFLFRFNKFGYWIPECLLPDTHTGVVSFRVWLCYDSLSWQCRKYFDFEWMDLAKQNQYMGTEMFRLVYDAISIHTLDPFLPLIIEFLGFQYDAWLKR